MTEDRALGLLNGLPALKNWIVGRFVGKEAGKGLSTNDYTKVEKDKLQGIMDGANKFVHPSYAAKVAGAYKVTIDATGHVSAAAPITKDDIVALGIPGQDTTYDTFGAATASVVGTNGLVPAPAAGAHTKFMRGDGTWQVPLNTTYSPATAGADGLLKKEDFAKLAAFQASANYALKTDIANTYNYKGSIANEAALPTGGKVAGDVYNIIAKSTYGPAGTNVAWTGTAWDSLGGNFEIEFATAAEVLDILNS